MKKKMRFSKNIFNSMIAAPPALPKSFIRKQKERFSKMNQKNKAKTKTKKVKTKKTIDN